MDALDVIRICARRYAVFLPILALAIGAGIGLSSRLKPEYHGFGSYAVVFALGDPTASAKDSDPRNANPLATDGGALLGEALMADLSSSGTETRLGGDNRGWASGQPDNGLRYQVHIPQDARSRVFLVETWGGRRGRRPTNGGCRPRRSTESRSGHPNPGGRPDGGPVHDFRNGPYPGGCRATAVEDQGHSHHVRDRRPGWRCLVGSGG